MAGIKKLPGFCPRSLSSHPADLNCRPADYESAALPAELEWHSGAKISNMRLFCQDWLTKEVFFSMIGTQNFKMDVYYG